MAKGIPPRASVAPKPVPNTVPDEVNPTNPVSGGESTSRVSESGQSSETPASAEALARSGMFGAIAPTAVLVDIDSIYENPHQARKRFDEQEISQLASSIKERGLLSPILVRKHETEKGKSVLVAGERRLRAFKLLGAKKIPAIITTVQDTESLSLIENVARANLSIIETSDGLAKLLKNGGYQHAEAASILGMSEAEVGEHMGILRLPDEILAIVRESAPDRFTKSALVELSRVEDEATRTELWIRMQNGALTVSELRSTKRAARTEQPDNYEGKALATLGKGLKSVGKTIESMVEFKGFIAKEHRERLLAIRNTIDTLLAEPEA